MPNPIGWCEETINPVKGCTKISPACQFCYAERMATRLAAMPQVRGYSEVIEHGHWNGKTFFDERELEKPRKWKRSRRIFVCSMGDLFHESVAFEDIHRVWDMMKGCPQHTFLILTKRPERMKECVEKIYCLERFGWALGFWKHVWLGATAENQEQANIRVPELLRTWAVKHFVSYEPALGPIDFTRILLKKSTDLGPDVTFDALKGWWGGANKDARTKLDQVIVGGCTGPGAPPMHPNWARKVRDDCKEAGTAFWFKGYGEWYPTAKSRCTTSGHVMLEGTVMARMGKSFGNKLDGRGYREIPE